jgi:spore coat protein YutH
MIEEMIYQNYGIPVEREEKNSRYPAFRSGDVIYSIIPIEKLEQEELVERQKMSEHLRVQGDQSVAAFVLANHGSYVSEVDEKLFVLLANEVLQPLKNQRTGLELGVFHARGRSITQTIKKCSRIGQWKALWEARIDQLEKVWVDKLQAHPNNEFEQLFIDTFPYYMVLGENAIQYLVDTEMDDTPDLVDSGTVCYERFQQNTWRDEGEMKNPFDWVFDHAARDIAEWVRDHYAQHIHTHQRGVTQFFQEYQSIERLSSFSARLLYARILFPIHYYEIVEEYFSNPRESRSNELEEALSTMTKTSQHYEKFLKSFFELAELPAKQMQLPEVDWL